MKILFYGLNYAPDSTGIPKYTAEMAAWLAAAGHQVEAISAFPHYPAWKVRKEYEGKGYHSESMDGVLVHRTPIRLPRSGRISSKDRIILELSFLFLSVPYFLKRLLPRYRYDLVICICPPMQSALPASVFTKLKSVPLVIHVQDLQVDAAVNLGMIKNRLLCRFLFATERFLLKRASLVSTISEQMRARIIAKGVPGERTCLTPNWANLDTIRPLPRMNSFRDKLGFGEDKIVVGFAGSLGEKHGLEVVLKAARILEDHENIRFVIVGDGSSKSRLQALSEELKLKQLEFLPMQPKEVLPDMLAAIDIHLVPQQGDAADTVMPSKLTNIFAAGRPTVATAAPATALSELLEHHQLGIVCEPGNPKALADSILLLANDRERMEQMGTAAHGYAIEALNIDSIMNAFLKGFDTTYNGPDQS